MITVLPPRKMPDEVREVLEWEVEFLSIDIWWARWERSDDSEKIFTARRDAIADYLKQNA